MTHTPGPWKVWDEGKTYPFEIYPGTGGAILAALPKSANAQANAHLIAAAPELLEALRAVLHRPDLIYDGGDSKSLDTCEHDGLQELVAQVRAVIAKAEGK